MRALVTICACVFVIGCGSNSERIDDLARSANLRRTVFEKDGYRTLIYMRPTASDRLVVFLEGDGIPWRDGIVPSDDPTTARPIALQMLIRTPGAGAYISRPCYQRIPSDRCTTEFWTNARYSEPVVDAMAETVREAQRRASARETVLVGHSGGGTLAVLIAERLEHISAVATIAANLDIYGWAQHHGYLPLEGSLNPAASNRDHPWREVHLIGRKDTVVPLATTSAYFTRYPAAQRWEIAEHGHVCCWLRDWDGLWKRIEGELDQVTGDE